MSSDRDRDSGLIPWVSRWRHPKAHGEAHGELNRLYFTRTRARRALFALLLFALVLAGLDLWLGREQARPAQVALTLAYGLVASVLATILVTLVQLHLTIQEKLDEPSAALLLLGIQPHPKTRVALVVTTRPGDGTSSTHTRLDMLLVADLIRLLQKAGLEAPLILSDANFLKDWADRKYRLHNVGVSRHGDSSVPITNLILVGLWGNQVVKRLAEAGLFTVRLDEGQDGVTLGRTHIASPSEHAFIGRFHLTEGVVAVLGGMYGIPTARLGDFLSEMPAPSHQLLAGDPSSDLWATLLCPGKGQRFKPYKLAAPVLWSAPERPRGLDDLLSP